MTVLTYSYQRNENYHYMGLKTITTTFDFFGRWKASLMATTVVLVLVVITVFEKCLRLC